MEAFGWQGPKLEKNKNAVGDYGGSIGGGFGNMFKTPKTYKTKVYKKGNSILKTNVNALNKEFKSVMKAVKAARKRIAPVLVNGPPPVNNLAANARAPTKG